MRGGGQAFGTAHNYQGIFFFFYLQDILPVVSSVRVATLVAGIMGSPYYSIVTKRNTKRFLLYETGQCGLLKRMALKHL